MAMCGGNISKYITVTSTIVVTIIAGCLADELPAGFPAGSRATPTASSPWKDDEGSIRIYGNATAGARMYLLESFTGYRHGIRTALGHGQRTAPNVSETIA